MTFFPTPIRHHTQSDSKPRSNSINADDAAQLLSSAVHAATWTLRTLKIPSLRLQQLSEGGIPGPEQSLTVSRESRQRFPSSSSKTELPCINRPLVFFFPCSFSFGQVRIFVSIYPHTTR